MFVRLSSMLLVICVTGCAGAVAPLSPLRSVNDSARAELPPRDTSFTVIHAFHGQPDDGSFPLGDLLLDSSGDVYGTTYNGGSADVDTIYELKPSSGTYTEDILYQFSVSAQYGFDPFAGPVRGPGGSLLLTASQGGPNGAGTVVRLTPNGGSYSVDTLPMQVTGFSLPAAQFLRQGGRFYATAQDGGSGGYGDVFEVTGVGTKVRPTYSFSSGSRRTDSAWLARGRFDRSAVRYDGEWKAVMPAFAKSRRHWYNWSRVIPSSAATSATDLVPSLLRRTASILYSRGYDCPFCRFFCIEHSYAHLRRA
jgi:hypothetical protein